MKRPLEFTKNFLLENWWLKLAGILVAYLLWLLVRTGEGERNFTIPLVLQVPRNMEIVNDHPDSVVATAIVAPHMVDKLPDLTYTIDLHTAGEGRHMVLLSPAGIPVSPDTGVTILRVNPSRMSLMLERVISRSVPVKVVIQGDPADGFQVDGAAARPDAVYLIGPRSKINAVSEAETGPIVVAGKKKSFSTTANISPRLVDIHSNPDTLEVTVEIGPRRPGAAVQGVVKK